MAKLPIVTERSGAVVDGGVVLAWCPTYKVMEKVYRLHKSVMVLVEWPPERFDGWAKLVGAYNALTGEVMESGLSADGLKTLEQIAFAGYKGWHDQIAERQTLSLLADLKAATATTASWCWRTRECQEQAAMERLEKILNKFEARAKAGR